MKGHAVANTRSAGFAFVTSHGARIIVDSEEIELLMDQSHILGWPIRPGGAEYLFQFRRIDALHRRIKKLLIHIGMGACGRGLVFRSGAGRIFGLYIDDQADFVFADFTIDLHRGAVRPHDVVSGYRGFVFVTMTGRERPVQITAICDNPRLVQRGPFFNTTIKSFKHDAGIVGKPVCTVAI